MMSEKAMGQHSMGEWSSYMSAVWIDALGEWIPTNKKVSDSSHKTYKLQAISKFFRQQQELESLSPSLSPFLSSIYHRP
jgi:hypothetical protein